MLIPWDYDPRYLPTSDSAYPIKELFADMARLRARNVVLVDACFSGLSEGGAVVKDASPVFLPVGDLVPKGIPETVVTASGPREIATWYSSARHGLLTYYVLRAFQGAAADPQGRLTVAGLKAYLLENVPPQAQLLRHRNDSANRSRPPSHPN